MKTAVPAVALTCALAFALAASTAVSAQSSGSSNLPEAPQPSQDREDRSTPAANATPPEPATTAPPRSGTNQPDSNPSSGGVERNVKRNPERNPERNADRTPEQSSSSEQERGDISPPAEDELAHPDAGGAHDWNPLRAMKNVEVGTYYYKAGNYKAAISRFREALEFKPRDADATFKLAQALEKNGELDEARTQYEAYLAILKDGPSAAEARQALQRLKKR